MTYYTFMWVPDVEGSDTLLPLTLAELPGLSGRERHVHAFQSSLPALVVAATSRTASPYERYHLSGLGYFFPSHYSNVYARWYPHPTFIAWGQWAARKDPWRWMVLDKGIKVVRTPFLLSARVSSPRDFLRSFRRVGDIQGMVNAVEDFCKVCLL
jgi:hypothetical protein